MQMTEAEFLEGALIGFCRPVLLALPAQREELTLQREGWRLGSRVGTSQDRFQAWGWGAEV